MVFPTASATPPSLSATLRLTATLPSQDFRALTGAPERTSRPKMSKKQLSAAIILHSRLLPDSSKKTSELNTPVYLVAAVTPGTSAMKPGATAPLVFPNSLFSPCCVISDITLYIQSTSL